MKLANALSQRSELQDRIRQLEHRLNNNAQVQEGESPAEDPEELLRELEEDYAQLEALIASINRGGQIILPRGKDVIREGDTVEIRSPFGGPVEARVMVSILVPPGLIDGQYGWLGKQNTQQLVCRGHWDPMSGYPAYFEMPVSVTKKEA